MKTNIREVVMFAICYLTAFAGHTQSIESRLQIFSKEQHTYQKATLPYRIAFPVNYDPTKSYPIILCLHGAGERGTDNETHVRKHGMVTSYANRTNKYNHPCFVVAPQCPKTKKWNYVDWNQGSFNMDSVTMGAELATVVNLLDSLLGKLNIDPNRQYITGLSMGGYATWDVITRYPNRFAAAAPMSGAGDPSKAMIYKNTPIWNFHNREDTVVPVEGSREITQAMEANGIKVVHTAGMSDEAISRKLKKNAKHLYTESSEGNHGPWEPWYTDERLHEWMFAQSRNFTE